MISTQVRNLISDYYKSIPQNFIEQGLIKLNNDLHTKENQKVLLPLVYMISYCDLYMSLNYKFINNQLQEEDNLDFSILKSVRSYNDLEKMYGLNPYIFYKAIESVVNFSSKSIFIKTLIYKSLGEVDYSKLENINKFLSEDNESYNKDITFDFILSNLSDTESIMDAARLLKNMINSNDKSSILCLDKMINNDKISINERLQLERDNDAKYDMIERIKIYENSDNNSIIKSLKIHQLASIIEYNKIFYSTKYNNGTSK